MNLHRITHLDWHILFLVLDGLDIPEIADRLQITEHLAIVRINRLFPGCCVLTVKT